jgi:hypothetical protein
VVDDLSTLEKLQASEKVKKCKKYLKNGKKWYFSTFSDACSFSRVDRRTVIDHVFCSEFQALSNGTIKNQIKSGPLVPEKHTFSF